MDDGLWTPIPRGEFDPDETCCWACGIRVAWRPRGPRSYFVNARFCSGCFWLVCERCLTAGHLCAEKPARRKPLRRTTVT